ncbi:MAG: hypothetical protein ACREHV_08170, partial [Rhizomicrobium sp.]
VMTGMGLLRTKWLAVIGVVAPACAFAQGSNYDVKTMNFDMWCQEQQHLDPDRCDKRLPADDAAFQAYSNKIESYEIPWLQRRDREENLNRVIIHNDPVDHPTLPSQPQADQPPSH